MDLPAPAAGMRWVADLTQDDEDIVWIQLPVDPNPPRRRRGRQTLAVMSDNELNQPRHIRQRRNPNEVPQRENEVPVAATAQTTSGLLNAEHFEGMGRKSSKQATTGKMTAYCVKCRAKCNVVDSHVTETKNHKKMMKGKCGVCGTTVCKFI